MKRIAIGTGASGAFTLPFDAATQTFAFIARKGAGKTYAAGKMVEEFIGASIQTIILDSVGNWFGLRLAANGKDAGLDIAVLGGLRGDIPLEPGAGELIADIAVDSGRSLILDISQFSKKDRQRFATAFGERLWRRKKGEESPTPIHLVIEESQLIIPESVGKDQTTMVGIYEEIIRLGRNYGIGCTMITQRPQSVNKEVLNQTECLFVLQVNGAHERKALKEWIVHQGMDPALLNELPSLPIGTAYVWSPQWLQILEKVKIGTKWTYDSTATPKPGQHRAGGKIKPLNLTDLREKMASIVKEAEDNDPAILKRKIRELEAKATDPGVDDAHRAQLTMLDQKVTELTEDNAKLRGDRNDYANRCNVQADNIENMHHAFKSIQIGLAERLALLAHEIEGLALPVTGPKPQEIEMAAAPAATPRNYFLNEQHTTHVPKSERRSRPVETIDGLSKMGQRFLTVLAQRKAMDKSAILLFAGYSANGATSRTFAELCKAGYMTSDSGMVDITPEGRKALGVVERLPSGRALRDRTIGELDRCEGQILKAWFDAYPAVVSKGDVLTRAGYSANGATSRAFARLTRRSYIVKVGKDYRASPMFFE